MHADSADSEPTPDLAKQIQGVVDRAAVDLFAAYDLIVEPVDAHDAGPRPALVVGVVEFAGDLIGELRLAVPPAALTVTCPIGAPQPWLGELANQLVGRVKNALWPSGITISMGAAMMALGGDPAVAARSYASAHGDVVAWLRFAAAPGVVWRDPSQTQRFRVAFEGDVMLF